MSYYESGSFPWALDYFSYAREVFGNPDAAYYEGLIHECGENNGEVNSQEALACYKRAENLGHYGAFKQDGKLLYQDCGSQEDIWLRMASDKADYLAKAETFSLKLKDEGNALFKTKQFKQALSKYQDAIKMNPTEAMFFLNQGVCYKYLGNKEAALESFAKALVLKPGYDKVQQQIDLLSIGHSEAPQTLFYSQQPSTVAVDSDCDSKASVSMS